MGDEVRTVQGISWRDPLAWMEPMKGERWEKFIKAQQERWASLTQSSDVAEEISLMESELEAVQAVHTAFGFGRGDVEIGNGEWRWKGEQVGREFSSIATQGDRVWATTDKGEGSLAFVLQCWQKGKTRPCWELKGVAGDFVLHDEHVYCLGVKKRLISYQVFCVLKETGKEKKVLYEEEERSVNLEFAETKGGVFVKRIAGAKQGLLELDEAWGVSKRLAALEAKRFIVDRSSDSFLSWAGEAAAAEAGSWRFHLGRRRRELASLRLPSFDKAVPELWDTSLQILVTKWHGERSLWKLHHGKPATLLWKGFGQITLDPLFLPKLRLTLAVGPTLWWTMKEEFPAIPSCLMAPEHHIINEHCGFVLLRPEGSGAPKGVLISGYGAYGLPTTLNTLHWQPLLHRGWAVAFGMWRGGGDHTPEREDAGRLAGREAVLEDCEAVVREVRRVTGVPAAKTVLYGRSAGGLWVGGMVCSHPTGKLFGGAYMEVPYLDVLRTVTNRSLPLTDIEQEEFGLPAERLSDFRHILRWSPMDNLPEGGVKGVWQVVRTGLNDSQVYAYEPAKWVWRSNGGAGAAARNGRAWLAVEEGQGHFVSGALNRLQQAEDLAAVLKLAGGE